MFKVLYGAVSDTGDVRIENQDSLLCRTGIVEKQGAALFVIADGMGGLSYGAQVSSYITRQFERWWQEDFPAMMKAGRDSQEDIGELLEQEIWDINRAVLGFVKETHCRSGSTLSLLLLCQDWYFIKNIGDSRVYRLRNKSLCSLTRDQSLVARMILEKKMTEEEARHTKQKNVLTMCVGLFEIPQSDNVCGKMRDGDVFLVCSDGLYNPLSQKQIEYVLADQSLEPQDKAKFLRQLIPPGKALDNVSAIVVKVER